MSLTEEKIMETKRIVKNAMRGFMPDEKLRAWRGVYNYMKMADLQQAIADQGADWELGEGNYAADIVIVTCDHPTKQEMEVLRSILRAIDIPEAQIYRTIAGDSNQPWDIQELGIINPAVAIYFGSKTGPTGIVQGYSERTKVLITHPLGAMLPDAPDAKTAKAEAWASLKEIMKHYDDVITREKV